MPRNPDRTHPDLLKMQEQLRQGRISRREFLRFATLFGVSTPVALGLAACSAPPTPPPTNAVATSVPTAAATEAPTTAPTEAPTVAPTTAPTEAATAAPTATPAAASPNILLIIGDDLGVDVLQFDDATDKLTVQLMGTAAYPLPNLTRLVAKGVHFTHSWAHPVCAPTRATVLTGLHPWRTTIGDPAGDPTLPLKLPADETTDLKTLANFVTDAGYECGFFGKWDLGKDDATGVPTARGWHRHEGILAGGIRPLPENPPNRAEYEKIIQHDVRYVSWGKVVGDAKLGTVVRDIPPEERTYKYATEDQVLSARDWIKGLGEKPWWATLAVFAPHEPFHIPPAETFTITFKDPANPTEQEMFVAMLQSLDYYLGQLFDDPDMQEQLQNTVIIFFGDNGTEDELDGVKGDDKGWVYVGGVHTPLIIADGGAIFGDGPRFLDADQISAENDALVHVVDIFQTIADLTESDLSSAGYTFDSISLVPYLKDTAADPRFTGWQKRAYNFSQFYLPFGDTPDLIKLREEIGDQATITDGQYKLNYQNGVYEFSQVTFDPATDLMTEKVSDNLQNPIALDLWKVLTTPGQYYAEMNNKGQTFPPLPTT